MKRFLYLLAFIIGCLQVPAAGDQPNFVIILADDLGYGDTQPFNSESKIETPNFNRLAKEGVIFTDAHSGSAVCTPTRYGLVCGRYAWRTHLKRGVLGGYSKPLIAPDQQTFAGLLSDAGYHTHVIGKWHLGLGWQWSGKEPDNINYFGLPGNKGAVDYTAPITDGPLDHGFTSCYLYPASLDMSPYVFIDDRKVETAPTRMIDGSPFPAFYRKGETYKGFKVEDVLGKLTRSAQSYIVERSKADEPFCLYFPLTAPHKPVSPSKDFVGKTKLGPYGDFITEVDWTVGEILKTLDETNTAENALVIVTSDNGSFMRSTNDGSEDHTNKGGVQSYEQSNHRANFKLRGTKADVFEAGHRVPYYIRWPSRIPEALRGTKSDATICHTDILATVCSLAGIDFDRSASPDSFDFSAHFLGVESKPRPAVINHSAAGMFAIRQGSWKLVLGDGSGGRAKPKGKPFQKPYQLFDLSSDLGEQKNVIEQHPEVAESMEKMLMELGGDDVPKK